ncbi:MAG: capsule assembly Wzi family protein [Longimicrobiales bacterium]|nr:capsule assembly Wzi family protein [Longimicrobiales bacterium]
MRSETRDEGRGLGRKTSRVGSLLSVLFRTGQMLFLWGCTLGAPADASGQVSTDLSPESEIPLILEKLVGFGLVDDRLMALRPLSRSEARRIIREARDHLERLDGEERRRAQAFLASPVLESLDADVHLDVVGTMTLLDSPWLPAVSRLGEIDAEINHLVRYRGGRRYVDGTTLAGELSLGAAFTDRLAVDLETRGTATGGDGRGLERDVRLRKASARIQLGNLRIDAGRSRSVWGMGREGGTLLTDNARPFDRVVLSSDSPFRWPGFLRHLGPTRAEIFFGLLEKDRDIPRSRLVGYALALRPHRLLEVHFSTLVQSGGSGAPQATAWERIADHLLLVDWIFNGGETFLFSNKGTSVGLRVRAPPLRHAQLFAELTLEDKAHDLQRLFWQDAAWHVGAWVPRLDASGLVDLRVELHHGGVRFHRHGQFTSGRTLDRRILGMGDAASDGGFVEVGVFRRRLRAALRFGVENRSADGWRTIPRPDGGIEVLDKIEDGPDELYLRSVVSLRTHLDGGADVMLTVGGQRVSDSRFIDGAIRWDSLLELGLGIPVHR